MTAQSWVDLAMDVFSVVGIIGVGFWVYVGVTAAQDRRKESKR